MMYVGVAWWQRSLCPLEVRGVCMDQVAICVSPLHVRPAQEQTRAQTMCTKNVVPVPIRVYTWKGYTRLLFLGVIMF